MRSVLTIAGSDPSGGAGISADLRAFSYAGVHGCSVITVVTSQNTKEFLDLHMVPLNVIENQLDAIFHDLKIFSCKTGMLYSPDIVKLVAEKIKGKDFPLVVDPVMKATVGDSLAQTDFVDSLKEHLIPNASLLTPNLPEAEVLLGHEIESIEDMKIAAKKIYDLGCKHVLIKGGHLKEKMAADVLYDGQKFHIYMSSFHPKEVHGSGCMHSALICAYLGLGMSVAEAQSEAKVHISNLIEDSYSIGDGLDVVGMLRPSYTPQELGIIENLKKALLELMDILPVFLIPEVGINLAYALPDAKSFDDVCALEGRLIRVGNSMGHLGGFKFGASKHVARIILTAMKYEPPCRSAMNIKYSPAIMKCISSLEFSVSSFDRNYEPEESSSMEWGTESAIEKFGGVPDIIFDEGGIGKEPMIRILGNDPEDVLGKLRKIVDNLNNINLL